MQSRWSPKKSRRPVTQIARLSHLPFFRAKLAFYCVFICRECHHSGRKGEIDSMAVFKQISAKEELLRGLAQGERLSAKGGGGFRWFGGWGPPPDKRGDGQRSVRPRGQKRHTHPPLGGVWAFVRPFVRGADKSSFVRFCPLLSAPCVFFINCLFPASYKRCVLGNTFVRLPKILLELKH